MSEPLRFSLRRKSIPIELEVDEKTVWNCTLQELKGSERDKWLNLMNKRVKAGGVQDFTGLHAELISASLVNPQGDPFSIATIQEWPASLQAALFVQAQELSGLNVNAEAQAKNV